MTFPVLAVHGGAGHLSSKMLSPRGRAPYEAGLARALNAGWNRLARRSNALDAVVAAVAALEDDPLFNAGRGSVLCADGSIELSASAMDGRDLSAGAVVGARRVKNPVKAARALMAQTHGLVFGAAADAFAAAQGLDMADTDYFFVERRKSQWERLRKLGKIARDHSDPAPKGTVGAVAKDAGGNLAAATSTGGMVNQWPGRVGDTPVVGAGTWADNRVCAISATGAGDVFARLAFSRRVADLMELCALPADKAAEKTLDEVVVHHGDGGCILVDASGRLFLPFNSPHMLRAWTDGQGRFHGAIAPGEDIPLVTG